VVRSFAGGSFLDETGDLTSGGAYLPAISANGQTYAFARSNWGEGQDTFVFASANGPPHEFQVGFTVPCNDFFTCSFGVVHATAASADGSTVAAVFERDSSDSNNIRLFDVAAGVQTRILTHNTATVGALSFSPDGSLLASYSADGKLTILRLEDLVVIASIPIVENGLPATVRSLAFSADGTLITIGENGAAQVYSIGTGVPVARIVGNTFGVAFTPDGLWLAVGTDREVRLWTLATSAPLPSFAPHFGSITSVAYSPRGDLEADAAVDGCRRTRQTQKCHDRGASGKPDGPHGFRERHRLFA
jgi:hypothetical protein